jgi:hypothetical protein
MITIISGAAAIVGNMMNTASSNAAQRVSKPRGSSQSPTRQDGRRGTEALHRSLVCSEISYMFIMCGVQHDEHGSFSCQHFDVAGDAAPRLIAFRMWSSAPVSVAHFSSGVGRRSRPRSKVSMGSTGRMIELGSSKEISAILSDCSWGVCRRQKRTFGRWMDATRDGR